MWADDDPVYSLTFTKMTTGENYNNYTAVHSTTSSSVSWNVYGNQSLGDYIRVGGKNTTATDRTLTSQSTIPNEISQIVIHHSGIGNGKSSSITINSITVEGATNSSFDNSISKTISSPSVSTSGDLEFSPSSGNWEKNSYYRITVNYQITGSNNCYITINSVDFYESTSTEPPITITPTANNSSWGAVSIIGNDITATPEDGYRVSTTTPYEVTSGNATVEQNGNVFTVTASADCTVQINFEEIPNHTISWSVNGVVSATSVPEGAAISFETPTSNIPYGYTFMGWYGSEYSSADTAPEYISSATCTDDATYYAVFAKGEEKSAWEKINVDEVPGEGIYAILTTDGHAFIGTISNGHGQVTETTFSFNTNNIAEMAPAGTCEIEFIASSDGNGYQMYNSNYGYLYATKAASGGLAWNDSDNSYWKYYKGNSETFGNWEYNKQFDGKWAYLRDYNNGSFRTYSTNSGRVILFAHKVTISSAADFRTSVVETATVGSAEWATWIAPNYVAVPTTVNAYIVEETTTSSAKLTEVLSIPAGQAVLLKTTGTHTFQVCSDEDMVDDYSGNLLKVSDEMTADGVYVLAKKSNGVGFYKWAGGLLGAGRVYLDAPAAAREFLSFDEDVPTSIETLVPAVSRGNDFYDLQGRKVAQPAKGLYIVNGKKVIIK